MRVRLLHMSDIHFGHENPAAVEAAAGFARSTPFDLLVVSGDVTQYGDRGEFAAASAWLASLPGPLISTPGNHDTPWFGFIERVVRPFDRYARVLGRPDRASFDAPGLSVEGLNSARGWQVRLNWSKGVVGRRQVSIAAERLEAAPPEALKTLVCHHPLVEVKHTPMTGRVRGGEAAAIRLVEAGVDMILTGHVHAPFVQALRFGDERTYAIGASTLSLRERGSAPGFNVIEADGDRLTVRAMGWDGKALELHGEWAVTLRPRRAREAPVVRGTRT